MLRIIFTNIPVKDCFYSVELLLDQTKVYCHISIELIKVIERYVFIKNYFQFQNRFVVQIDGLTMGVFHISIASLDFHGQI